MKIGLIGAMDEEIIVIKEIMKNISEEIYHNSTFITGTIYNKNVVLVKSGIGMVNASMITTILITKYNVDKIIFSGVAGSLDAKLNVGDIVVSSELIEYLFDATAFGYSISVIPRMDTSIFKADTYLLNIAKEIKNIHIGRILSADKFVDKKNDKIRYGKEYNALAVDMESAAVAHVSHILGIPFLVIRSISDSLNDDSVIEYNEFVNIAAVNSKNILLSILKEL